jgi:ABC-2 type transport system permease protein
VVIQAWFYLSPIMYAAGSYRAQFGARAEHLALINPVALLLTQMGHAFIAPASLPSAASAGGGIGITIGLAMIPFVFALGWWVFTREAPRVAENL